MSARYAPSAGPPSAQERISRARSRLLLDQPWFGSLSLRLQVAAAPELTETMSTDGTRLVYYGDWVAQRSDAELMAVVAHEVLHCALLHPYRVGRRDLKLWNLACDYAINPMLLQQGFRLPEGMVTEPRYAGLSAETIYALLERDRPPSDQPSPGGQGGDTPPSASGGDFTPAPQPGPAQPDQPDRQPRPAPTGMTATDWQIAAEQATSVARKAGSMDGGTDRAVKQAQHSATDWRAVLWRWIEHTVPSDYSWSSPNRRYIAAGLYLPGVVRQNMPRLAAAVDTSRSIGQDVLDVFGGELTAILHEVRPESLVVAYCDTKIQGSESFDPDDPAVELHPRGGGGTRFQPVFDYFRDDPPAGLVYLTDLEGPVPSEPDFPVLWATTEAATAPEPFGERLTIGRWED